MKTSVYWLACMTILCCPVGCWSGSSAKVDPQQLAAARAKYVLPAEPGDVEGVLDVQEGYQAPRDVVIVGQIGGVKNPWSTGKAVFILADPIMLMEQDTDHVCQDAGCKFCARKRINKLKEGLAVVEFKDDVGEIVPIDARELFDIAESQMVVVRGRAHVNDLGCLVVSANGLYIRQ